MDTKHNPEFSTIELYQAYTDYHGMMDITEDMVVHVCEKGSEAAQGDVPRRRDRLLQRADTTMTMAEAVKEYAGIDFMALSPEEALEAVKAKGLEIEKGKESWGDLMSLCYDEYVEENLMQPTFITDYPVEISPLAKRKPSDPRLTGRFECLFTAASCASAFSAFRRPRSTRRSASERQVALRAAGAEGSRHDGRGFHQCAALEYGMPPRAAWAWASTVWSCS